jgi:pimeloyl-ACP methyl ester carboxylesterase
MIRLQQSSFTEPADPHKHDDEPIVIHARFRRVGTNLVVFVHGLTGHRYGYWGNTPRFVLEDLPTADIGLYFYRTAWRRLGLFRSIDLEQEARVFADALRQLRLYEAVTIVGHSMGGLLAKAAIVDLINRNQGRVLRRIASLVLLACPQLGSLRVPRLLKAFSRDGRALFPHNKTIQCIDTVFAERLSIDQAADPLDRDNIPTWAVVLLRISGSTRSAQVLASRRDKSTPYEGVTPVSSNLLISLWRRMCSCASVSILVSGRYPPSRRTLQRSKWKMPDQKTCQASGSSRSNSSVRA